METEVYDKLIPLGSRIVAKPDAAADVSRGGVHVPETARDRHKPQEATVLAVGPGRLLDNGALAKIDERIAPGARILHTRYGGTEVNLDGDVVLILAESEVLSIVKDGAAFAEQKNFAHRAPDQPPTLGQHLATHSPELETPRKHFPVS